MGRDQAGVSDFHLPNWVSWNLAREPRGNDERMLELLDPWEGHRGRALRLIVRTGTRPPAYGPRLAARILLPSGGCDGGPR